MKNRRKQEHRNSRFIQAPLIAILIVFVAASCSTVFTSSITGRVIDSEAWVEEQNANGINDVEIYLYTDESERDSDIENWDFDNNVPPVNNKGEYSYFLKTVTSSQGGEAGSFTFNGLIWNVLFPEYGKSGDRKEVFFILYHARYGVTPASTYIVSDVTNRMSPVLLERKTNTATIRGEVYNHNTDEPEPGVTVGIWVPTSWEYDGSGAITGAVYDEEPTYSVGTDDNGVYEREITFSMEPSIDENQGTTRILMTFEKNQFALITEESDYTDAGQDNPPLFQSNQDLDGDSENDSYLSLTVTEGSTEYVPNVRIRTARNTATITGIVYNVTTGEPEPGVTVDIWIPDEWEYDTNDAITATEYGDTPSYSVNTNVEGEYEQEIRYPMKPSVADNIGTTEALLTYEKTNFDLITTAGEYSGFNGSGGETIPQAPTFSGTIDLGDDGETDTYITLTASDETTHTVESVLMKQTDFTTDIEGRIYSGASSSYVNGALVTLYVNRSTAPDADDSPDYRTYTVERVIGEGVNQEVRDGYFRINDITWEDASYTTPYSEITCYIDVDVGDDGTIEADDLQITLYSDITLHRKEINVP